MNASIRYPLSAHRRDGECLLNSGRTCRNCGPFPDPGPVYAPGGQLCGTLWTLRGPLNWTVYSPGESCDALAGSPRFGAGVWCVAFWFPGRRESYQLALSFEAIEERIRDFPD